MAFAFGYVMVSTLVEMRPGSNEQEKGTGLGSSLQIYCKGAGAEAMIVSRNGIYYQTPQKSQVYSLNDVQKFEGTLISIRIPMQIDAIDIYKYV